MKKHYLWLAALPVCLSGCASIVKGSAQDIKINSTPSEAQFEIRDLDGQYSPISGTTPATVTLKKKARYFAGAKYEIVLTKPGFEAAQVNVDSRVTWWYLAGNLVFGGLIGLVGVDPATGAMWLLEPDEVNVNLVPLAAAANPLPEEVPPQPAVAAGPAPVASAAPKAPVAAGPVAVEVPVAQPDSVPAAPVAGDIVRMMGETPIRSQPRLAAPATKTVPAGTVLTLKSRMDNPEGGWWFVEFEGGIGWLPVNDAMR